MVKSFFSCNRGYTFIELLIAVSILGIVVSPFLALFSGSFLSITGAGRQSVAMNLCREQYETVKSLNCPALQATYLSSENILPLMEEIPSGYEGFSRSTSVETVIFSCTNNPSLELELLLIEVAVSWEQGGAEKSETLSGYYHCR